MRKKGDKLLLMILENGHLKINEVHQGDCLELMKFIPDKSIDAIISDPPLRNDRLQVGYYHSL